MKTPKFIDTRLYVDICGLAKIALSHKYYLNPLSRWYSSGEHTIAAAWMCYLSLLLFVTYNRGSAHWSS